MADLAADWGTASVRASTTCGTAQVCPARQGVYCRAAGTVEIHALGMQEVTNVLDYLLTWEIISVGPLACSTQQVV